MVTYSCGGNEGFVVEMGNDGGEGFGGEAMGDGAVVVDHTAEHGD
jgi:hypothetical protein